MRELYADYPSPVGLLRMSGTEEAITGLWFFGQRYFAATLDAFALCAPEAPLLRCGFAWLDAYFAQERPDAAALPLRPRGSAFQCAVWRQLCTIPYGETRSYGEIAAQLARERGAVVSARAVGAAVGRNPISILIPCHRVIGADGSLTGYAGGLDKKRALLAWEGAGS